MGTKLPPPDEELYRAVDEALLTYGIPLECKRPEIDTCYLPRA
jgi:hypothetical protein